MTTKELVEVVQADIDAVAAFHKASFRCLFETTDEDIDAGINRAHTLLCEAFARHRLSAEAAIVAWLREQKGHPQACESARQATEFYAQLFADWIEERQK